MVPHPLLSERQAAEYIGMSPRYLQERRYRGGGPEYIRISHRAVKYHPDALAQWLSERSYTATCEEPTHEPTQEPAAEPAVEPAVEPRAMRAVPTAARVAGRRR